MFQSPATQIFPFQHRVLYAPRYKEGRSPFPAQAEDSQPNKLGPVLPRASNNPAVLPLLFCGRQSLSVALPRDGTHCPV